MKKALAPLSSTSLARFGFDRLPRVITNAGERATRRFVEFFTANIRNKNTRLAQAVGRFLEWCERRRFELIEPVVVAAYIEELMLGYEPPTVKRHLAAIRMHFDYLVVGQVIPMNPASSVRRPTHVVKKGQDAGPGRQGSPGTPRQHRHYRHRRAPRPGAHRTHRWSRHVTRSR